MNSRSILFAAGFCLACIVVLGSAALQLAVGDARVQRDTQTDRRISAAVEEDTAASDPDDARQVGLSSSRKLEALLRHAEALMEANPVASDSLSSSGALPLSEEVVAVFAEMVKIIDESAYHRFEIVIADPDSATSYRRAEVIRGALLLAVRYPSKLRITENLADRPLLTVRAIETHSSL